MINFFQPSNLFDWGANYSNEFLTWELIIFGIFFIFGLIFKILLLKKSRASKAYKILSNKIYSFLTTCAILGFVLIFCQWQSILFLSAPILLVILIIVFIFWLVTILKYYLKEFKISYKKEEQNNIFKKYLPNKK